MKKYVVIVILALSLVALFAVTAAPAFACQPLSPGFWMNHPEAWPSDTITIGGIMFAKADAIALMKAPTRGDMSLAMFQAVMAARLNELTGSVGSGIPSLGAWYSCWQWLLAHPAGSGVAASSPAWQSIANDYKTLCAWWVSN
jgi:hypothetical protein